MLPTVRAILDLPVLRAASPTVLGGAQRLDTPVRWVHVSEILDVGNLLSGGELVLTTGLELEKFPEESASFISSLEAAGAAGLMVELIGQRPRSRQALEKAARSASMPVVMVEQRVRFVQVTEIVHRMIVAEQLERVERARDVHEAFTVLSLESADTQRVVEQAAAMIGASVVLEDLSHLVLAYAGQRVSTTELLQDWERRSRTTPFPAHTARSGPEQWLQAAVGVRQQVWGRLVVPMPPAALDADEDMAIMVLERAAQTLAINRLADRDQRELSHHAQAGLLNALRQPRGLSEAEALARAGSLGLKRSSYYVPLVFRSALPAWGSPILPVDPFAGQQDERELLERLAKGLKSSAGTALAASIQSGSVGMILALPARQQEETTLQVLAGAAAGQSAEVTPAWIIGVGRMQATLLEAAAGIDEAAHVAESAATLRNTGKLYFRATDVRLRGLLALLRKDPRVQQFVESELSAVLQADAEGKGEYLELLGLYLGSGGNKAAMARSGYLSRPTLYARLRKLEDLLGVDLEDAESRTSLHVALLAHLIRGQ
ncbi:PucR family transcriptional regulator [Paenarthrobacter aurescens]|uniref:Putative regulatory protein n=1 Tax=Paenarthrobacter aurescens TaxID=43663 RepID=A0A4Y3NM61_PAEAU|nr:PucR family transcriptional regulator [Paenarthrobacter aurescens]MDO6145143.1 PucR family transcriptional regulator [Paenarthrobacter aurescens]MDO6148988.1 PucR family transcriptional regulator [Paenarthrobacter aurescens]MDO6160234.1 PucR family transcriptional regulator [Paenarthrobacter aurescens]MDO6164093.1 PucR family transcriptional regulator [Paenarthrobacter aurescens]GEB20276.1 putative regulatory protein [Paenarthrobacter aurescens]